MALSEKLSIEELLLETLAAMSASKSLSASTVAFDAAAIDYTLTLDDSTLRYVVNLAGLVCQRVCKRWRTTTIDYIRLRSNTFDEVPLLELEPEPPTTTAAAVLHWVDSATATDPSTLSLDRPLTTSAASRAGSSSERAHRWRRRAVNCVDARLAPVLSRVRALELCRSSWPLDALDAVFDAAPKLERLYLKCHR